MSKAIAKKDDTTAVVPQTEAATMFSLIERMMSDENTSIERAEKAFGFYQKVRDDQAKKDFNLAFISAQREMESVRKAANNPQTKSKYATFEALDNKVRPIYTKHGFGVTFSTAPSEKPEHVKVICHILHESGHEREYPVDMPADGKGEKGGDVMTKTHATGSAISYGKRYAFGAAWNIITTERDDDGNGAGGAIDGLEPITDDQVSELIAIADKVGADKEKFCKFANIESFADILRKDFTKAKALLEAKGKKT